jgi:NTE family protein
MAEVDRPDLIALKGRAPTARPKSKAHRKPGIAICLSGGGYRAMLFHLGALRRLNELGLLWACDRFSSVSGGSLTAGVLATRWSQLDFAPNGVATNFDIVEAPVMEQAGRRVDIPAVVVGLLPGTTAANQVARHYRRHLVGEVTLQELPDVPRFVFDTTNTVTGSLLRWSKPYAADYQIGEYKEPAVPIATVIAASSAFPPFLSPLRMRAPNPLVDFATGAPVADAPTRLQLSDGGVYDNLGLQPADEFHTILVSDAGLPFAQRPTQLPDWLSQLRRTASLIDRQVRAQRRGNLVDEFEDGFRLGTLWTIQTSLSAYPVEEPLPATDAAIQDLARIPTRLWPLPPVTRRRLVNLGYAEADAAVRAYLTKDPTPPPGFPFPDGIAPERRR